MMVSKSLTSMKPAWSLSKRSKISFRFWTSSSVKLFKFSSSLYSSTSWCYSNPSGGSASGNEGFFWFASMASYSCWSSCLPSGESGSLSSSIKPSPSPTYIMKRNIKLEEFNYILDLVIFSAFLLFNLLVEHVLLLEDLLVDEIFLLLDIVLRRLVHDCKLIVKV